MYFAVEVLEKAKTFILNNFSEIVTNCSEFYFLSSEEMCELLAEDRLNASREELTYSALVSWVSVNPQRIQHFPKLLRLVRFGNSSLK